jgi:ubiquinone/menaquinone biosynthesis C-methylase UbiE
MSAELSRAMWAAGDYPSWGDRFIEVGRTLVTEVGVAGLDVLDVATGHGTTAIAAAKAGGRVTGLDFTPELLDAARKRARDAGVDITWIEADMMSAPLPDRSFDRVLSSFGAMAAPDPSAMAAELVRLCRRGGVIASTAWSVDAAFSKLGGVVGQFLAMGQKQQEQQRQDGKQDKQPLPTDWAEPELVESYFEGLPVTVTTTPRTVAVTWSSVDEAIDNISTQCGPLIGAIETLKKNGDWDNARTALVELLEGEARSMDGELTIDMPYAVTIARRTD